MGDAFGVGGKKITGYGEFCQRSWPYGLALTFVSFRGDPCGYGGDASLVQALVRSRRWQTSRGLRVGDPPRQLRRLYPAAARHGHTYWLATAVLPDGLIDVRLRAIVWGAACGPSRSTRRRRDGKLGASDSNRQPLRYQTSVALLGNEGSARSAETGKDLAKVSLLPRRTHAG